MYSLGKPVQTISPINEVFFSLMVFNKSIAILSTKTTSNPPLGISDKANNQKEAVENSKEIENEVKLSNLLSINSFRRLVDLFYQKREGLLHTLLYNNVKLVSFKEGEIIINAETITDPHFMRTIAKFVSKWTGRIWQVSASSSNIGKTLYEEDLLKQQKEIEIMKNDLEIKQILSKYSDVKIHSITNIGETLDEIVTKNDIKQVKEK